MKTSKRQTNTDAPATPQEQAPQEQPVQAPLPDTAHDEAPQALETRLSEAEASGTSTSPWPRAGGF